MLEYVSNVEKRVTFAYKDVHFIHPKCGADGGTDIMIFHHPPITRNVRQNWVKMD